MVVFLQLRRVLSQVVALNATLPLYDSASDVQNTIQLSPKITINVAMMNTYRGGIGRRWARSTLGLHGNGAKKKDTARHSFV